MPNDRNELASRIDPAPAYKFHVAVEVDGILEAFFTECSGLTMQREVTTYKEGGVNDYVHHLPGRVTYTNVVLKRGITASSVLWDWFQQGLYDGKVKRINVSILMFDRSGEVLKRWELENAYPVKWTGPEFKSDSNQAAIESLELTFDRLLVQTV
jgi:phage tail-like protein